ncbi:hypothetical protein EROM_090270 [Encephalitozoon romaleae SJ-2008]|uniref:DUF5096 domain-containing protein n=1 Tax=Encephalitozoon romaleae (strain SJ-2008) TaxID=1178016 RepID=I7APA5_ENCRO|nr:hypothetical protein EROM_090270 [Encephalitozoon romaleae SJ-2008]AFN83644.1 hypothetical protein EROM_090270 [Encephalitozoon romaleae SJ-2008]
MEDYIGTRLLFETSKGMISGMLKAVDENVGKLVIEGEDGTRDVLIEDIQRLEIVEEPSSNISVESKAKEDEKAEVLNPSIGTSDKSTVEASRLHSVSHVGLRTGTGLMASSERYKSSQTDTSRTIYENGDNTRSSGKTGIEGKDDRNALETSEENYYGMMKRAFCYFGPLEEEFCSIAARQAYRIFSTYFGNSTLKVEVLVSGDGVFPSIGLILGRLLLNSGKKLSVICNEIPLRSVKYKQSYMNSGGIIANKPSLESTIQIYSCGKALISTWPRSSAKGFMYLDTPGFIVEERETKIGLCFGSIPTYFRKFNGIVYFVDMEYPSLLYEEFGLQRPTKSKIHKVK